MQSVNCRHFESFVIMLFGVVTSNSDVMPSFIFPRSLELNMEAYIERVTDGNLTSVNMPHKQGNPLLVMKKISVTTSSQTSSCRTPKIAISLIIIYGSL